MAYAPPPGTNSLPARPPPAFTSSPSSSSISPSSSFSNNINNNNNNNSNSNNNTVRHGFRPAFASAQTYQAAPSYAPGAANNYSSQNSYSSRSQYGASSQYGSTASYQSSSSSSSYGPVPGVTSSTGHGYASQHSQQQSLHQPHQQQQHQQQLSQQGYGSQNSSNYGSSSNNNYAPPQIQNPFPAPGTAAAAASAFDPSEAAQIAEWQSAYSAAPQTITGRDGKPLTLVSEPSKPEPPAVVINNNNNNNNPDKKKTVVRQGGGKKWTDDTLLEWDPSHLRLFVGNLAGETTDESLLKAFARWKSVQKARVIRDKRTTKSKGYGFVSFSNADDFFQAAKEMNGKYIQSHPVVVRKANTEIKVSNVKDKAKSSGKNHHNNNNNNKKNHSNNNNNNNNNINKNGHHGHGLSGGYEPSLGPVPGSGVTKPGQKTKNGLRLLG